MDSDYNAINGWPNDGGKRREKRVRKP